MSLTEAERSQDIAWTQDHGFGTNPFLHSTLSPGFFSFPNPLEKIKTKKQISLAVAKLSPESGQLGEMKPQPTPATHTHTCALLLLGVCSWVMSKCWVYLYRCGH